MNVKVVERLYREERLALRRRERKKISKGVREGAIVISLRIASSATLP